MATHTHTPAVTRRYLLFDQIGGLKKGEAVEVIDLHPISSYVSTRLGERWITTHEMSYFEPEPTN